MHLRGRAKFVLFPSVQLVFGRVRSEGVPGHVTFDPAVVSGNGTFQWS